MKTTQQAVSLLQYKTKILKMLFCKKIHNDSELELADKVTELILEYKPAKRKKGE